MYLTEKLLEMLTSKKTSVRYDACEWLRVRQESSPEIVMALERATYDEDKEVAERAKYALQADVHHKMAIKMGIIKSDNAMNNRSFTAPQINPVNQKVNADKPMNIFLVIIGIIFAVIGFVQIVNALSTQKVIDSSKSWPAINGEILSSQIKYLPPSEWTSASYEPKITYIYTVSGVNYACDMKLGSVSIKSQATDIQEKYVVGSQIKVFYNPENPQLCATVFDEVPMNNWIIGMIFIVVGLTLAVGAVSSFVRK